MSCKNNNVKNDEKIIINTKNDNSNLNSNDNIMETTTQNIDFFSLFNESSIIKFTPKELENSKDPNLIEFKINLLAFEKSHPLIKDFEIENLNLLINNQTFSNSDYFINSEWLSYFIKKYNFKNLDLIMNSAIIKEDYNAVQIILKTGYILSKKDVLLALESEKNAILNIKIVKEKNGLDEKGNPIFYDDKESKAKEILSVLIKRYKYKIFDKDGYTNLRDDSFNSAYILGTIKSGESIDIDDNTNQEWLYIKTKDNREGYVHKSRIIYE
jgi:hypothetical protein